MTASQAESTPTVLTDQSGRWLDLRFGLAALAAGAAVAVVIGIPTDLLANPWFVRMIPAEPINYVWWIGTSALVGPLIATYLLPGRERFGSLTAGSGVLGLLAAGCPICNKVVVALLGVSGALDYFAPIQPVLGALGLLSAGAALYVRLNGARQACRVAPLRSM